MEQKYTQAEFDAECLGFGQTENEQPNQFTIIKLYYSYDSQPLLFQSNIFPI
jgi:hypothetical protein